MPSSVAISQNKTASVAVKKKAKSRFAITLSQPATRAFTELKEWTDSDTDSEVFRNALRLHKDMLNAHMDGVKFYKKEPDSDEMIQLSLFVAS